MSDSRSTRLALVLMQLAAAWACATAYQTRALLGLGLVSLGALFFELPRLPAGLARLAPRLVLGLNGLVALVGLAWVLFLPGVDGLAENLPPLAGPLLAGLAALLLLARRSVPLARGALPATLGALLAAAFVREADLQLPFAAAGLAALALLAGGAPPRHRLRRLLAVAAPAVAVSLGLWRLLPWAQPFVEAAVADVTNPTQAGMTGFGGPSRLGESQALARSTRPLLRLYASSPSKLRGQVLTRFDGRSWSAPAAASATLDELREPLPALLRAWGARLPGAVRLPAGTDPARLRDPALLTGSVLPVAPGPPLFVPFGLVLLKAEGEGLGLGPGGAVTGREVPDVYGFVASPVPGLDQADCEDCLSLPARLDPRLRALAGRLAEGAPGPAERVQRTLRHLDECCRYSLEPGAFRTSDPLAEFLFEKRTGYCEYFASAAALLLRLQGVPTRYVKGLQVGEAQRAGEHYLLRESDAHAWIDARLPGGWRELDPTPPDDYAAAHAAGRLGVWGRAWEALAARAAWWRAALVSLDVGLLRDGLRRAWPWLAALSSALLLRWWRKRRPAAPARAAATPLRADLRDLVRRLDRSCARAGAPRPASRGLLEHLDQLPDTTGTANWRAAARQAAAAVYEEAYGGRPLAPGRLRDLRERL